MATKRQLLEQTVKKNAQLESKISALRAEMARLEPLLETGRLAELELRAGIPAPSKLFSRIQGPGRPAGGEKTLQKRDRTFWQSVHKQEDGCWVWLRENKLFPHRGCTTAKQVAWLLTRGTQPVGRLDATCRTDGCINPDHQD